MKDTTHPDSERRIGEVVGASTIESLAQCYRLYEAPPLGALVRCGGENPIYGIVGEVRTESLDPGRRPIAMGEEDDTEDEIYRRNPQVSRLLSTLFRVITVGYQSDGRVNRYLAPLPPRIHAFVHQCGPDELREFSRSLDFMSILLAAPFSAQDDIIASFLRQASLTHPDPEGFLVDAGKKLATLIPGQLPRLNAILKKLSP